MTEAAAAMAVTEMAAECSVLKAGVPCATIEFKGKRRCRCRIWLCSVFKAGSTLARIPSFSVKNGQDVLCSPRMSANHSTANHNIEKSPPRLLHSFCRLTSYTPNYGTTSGSIVDQHPKIPISFVLSLLEIRIHRLPTKTSSDWRKSFATAGGTGLP